MRELEPEALDLLARGAGRALVMSRLLIGRCLEELGRRQLAQEWGYSGPIHYAVRVLRISAKAAREARRVARELVPLPKLSEAAEDGEIGWSHLREVVRVAVPQTEEAWIDAARRYRWRTFHRLVCQAGPGDLPGEVSPEACVAEETELRIRLSLDCMELVTGGLARLSRRMGRMVGPAEGLEYAFAELLADDDANLDLRLQQARILLGGFRDLRDRQERQEDARAHSAAVRAWRQGQLREAEGGKGAGTTQGTEPAGDEAWPTWVTDDPPGRVHEVPQPSLPLPFAYPAPASGEALLRDAEEGEADLEPPLRWEMVSAGSSPLPGCLDLSLVSPDRRPFWEQASGPARLPGARSRTDREARRSRAIERGAHARRGSAEAQRTVQRRDGFACQCPDCPHTVWLHLHHLTLYCRGGLSVPSNQVLVCSTCHRNLHRGRLKVTGNPEAGLEWRDGRGLPLGEAPAAVARRARGLGRGLLARAVG